MYKHDTYTVSGDGSRGSSESQSFLCRDHLKNLNFVLNLRKSYCKNIVKMRLRSGTSKAQNSVEREGHRLDNLRK